LVVPKKTEKKYIVNGYLPLHGTKIMGKPPEFTDDNDKIDSFASQNFENFIKTLTEKHIKVYVIQSPLYVKPFATSVSLERMKSIAKKYNVPFWDYAFDTSFYKREYFYDNIHLNDKGAKAFSAKIASAIEHDMKKNLPDTLQQK
jgi:lysophospholipase L1-like esterase